MSTEEVAVLEGLRAIEKRAGEAAAISREQAEIQGQLLMAKRFPRSVEQACSDVIAACQRPTFAAMALYCYPRAGTKVEGPSVNLAREMARAWGNLRYGYRVADADPAYTTVEGFCFDCQANTLKIAATRFRNLIYRKKGGWQPPDERDYRELVAKNGAIAERNAILQLLPVWLREEAVAAVKKTAHKAAQGEVEQDREGTIRSIVIWFRGIGVSVDMLETRLGHPMASTTADEIVELRGIAKAIHDGEATLWEFFERPGGADEKKKTKAQGKALDRMVEDDS